MKPTSAVSLVDAYNRRINYLRLSVTDRCNLRCFYCMPESGVQDVGHSGILSFEELQMIAESAVRLGIEKIRITGGEPTVRAGLVDFLARLSAIPGLHHLALTTNGLLLEEMAVDLYRAGLQRLNVSLLLVLVRCVAGDLSRHQPPLPIWLQQSVNNKSRYATCSPHVVALWLFL